MKKSLAVLVLLLCGVMILSGLISPHNPAAGGPRVNDVAPILSGQTLQGQPIALQDLKGKAVFLNFWASWCVPCRLEMPDIQRLTESLPAGTAILTVNMTNRERSPRDATAYMSAHGYTFAAITDPRGELAAVYHIISMPTSLFIDANGVISARVAGPLSGNAMRGYLDAARRQRTRAS